jgi:hypothetical protein
MQTDRKRRLRELLAKVPMDPAERAVADDCVARMSDAQAEETAGRIAFADDLSACIADDLDRLFGPESTKGEA